MPSPGSVRPLYMVAAELSATISRLQRIAWGPVVVLPGPGVRRGQGRGRGEGLGKVVALRRPYTQKSDSFPCCLPREVAVVSVDWVCPPWTSLVKDHPLEAPSSQSKPTNMPPFFRWEHWISHSAEQVWSAPQCPTSAWKTPLLFVGYPGPGRTVVAHFWHGLGPVRVCSVQVWALRDVNNMFLSFYREPVNCAPLRCWSTRRTHPKLGSNCFWKISASFSFFSTLPSSAEICLSPSSTGPLTLALSHPVCSKHQESKSSLYPSHFPQFLAQRKQSRNTWGRKEWMQE